VVAATLSPRFTILVEALAIPASSKRNAGTVEPVRFVVGDRRHTLCPPLEHAPLYKGGTERLLSGVFR
jgi:hypothetical protein